MRQQVTVLDTVEKQLRYQPAVETRNRKPMRPNPLAPWELRIGDYRVFYEIREESVRVLAIGHKVHNELFIRGQKVEI